MKELITCLPWNENVTRFKIKLKFSPGDTQLLTESIAMTYYPSTSDFPESDVQKLKNKEGKIC